jgi:hypothetical protein
VDRAAQAGSRIGRDRAGEGAAGGSVRARTAPSRASWPPCRNGIGCAAPAASAGDAIAPAVPGPAVPAASASDAIAPAVPGPAAVRARAPGRERGLPAVRSGRGPPLRPRILAPCRIAIGPALPAASAGHAIAPAVSVPAAVRAREPGQERGLPAVPSGRGPPLRPRILATLPDRDRLRCACRIRR